MTSLFLFRRDLRIHDNLAFNSCCSESTKVIPAFIFTPEQIDPAKNKVFSHSAVQFMCESIADLQQEFQKHHKKLYVFHGDNLEILQEIFKVIQFENVYFNKDHSVYAVERDAKILKWCAERNIAVHGSFEDYTLLPLKEGLVSTGKPYTILAQFYKRYLKNLDIPKPIKKLPDISKCIGLPQSIPTLSIPQLSQFYDHNPHLIVKGGRNEALKRLKILPSLKTTYGTHRNFPYEPHQTTRMSAHLKFGTISIRQMYWECVKAFGTKDHPLIRELFFREFYIKIYALNPELQRTQAFLPHVEAKTSYLKPGSEAYRTAWTAWTTGNTGFPLVDAGMRQLLEEGFVHNRVRMVQGSIATRVMALDWRDCSRYYASKLVDICPFVNTASWQWCAGVGVDAMWYRSPFNPFIQSKKFDEDCIYIKKYVPELKEVDPKHIHKWDDPKVRAMYPNIKYGNTRWYKTKN